MGPLVSKVTPTVFLNFMAATIIQAVHRHVSVWGYFSLTAKLIGKLEISE